MTEDPQTPTRSRDQLLAALSAAGAAITGLSEAMRVREGGADPVADLLAEGQSYTDAKLFLPLQEEALEPLADALRLTMWAVGYPTPCHGLGLAIERFLDGDA